MKCFLLYLYIWLHCIRKPDIYGEVSIDFWSVNYRWTTMLHFFVFVKIYVYIGKLSVLIFSNIMYMFPFYLFYLRIQNPVLWIPIRLSTSSYDKGLFLPNSSHIDAGQRLQKLAKSRALAKKCLSLARQKQSKYANKNRKPEDFRIGQLVWLSTKYLTREGKRWNKLQPKWLGPFQIISKISENAFKINSQDFGHKFHPVVNVSRLKPYPGETPQTGNQDEIAATAPTNPI